MRRHFLARATVVVALLAVASCAERRYTPPKSDLMSQPDRHPAPAYDVWGRSVSQAEADQLMQTEEGRAMLSPANGAVRIDDAFLDLGKRTFYEETFGNEVFLTDVMGIMAGPITPTQISKAVLALKGAGTGNLQVELATDATVGGVQYRKGQKVDTGIDVPKAAIAPMGMTIRTVGTKIYAGVTCALCHSTVDPQSKLVVHGAPNADLNGGLLMAMATNTASYFTHADVTDLSKFAGDPSRTVKTVDGRSVVLPDPRKLEDHVDSVLLKWPAGSFDSMTDLVANPAQIPSSFTLGNHPYSFSGAFLAGSFRGLSVQNNNVHALNSDAITEADAAPARFNIDREVFIATVMQNAASKKFRYDPGSGRPPSEFFKSVDPTPGQPSMNHVVALPTYPASTLIEPTSLWNSLPKSPVWSHVNAMSAWQNTIVPPPPPIPHDAGFAKLGRQVFERANCVTCHSGDYLTNNRIIPAPEIGTQPLRAKGMMSTGFAWRDPVAYAFDQPVPLPENPRTIPVPTDHLDPQQIRLAYGWGDSPGGYKVPALVGLYWTAPYLHDGGVAAGQDVTNQVGLPGTQVAGYKPDPANSLRALFDRDLRKRVVDANHAHPDLAYLRIEGIGHTFWVDTAAGFTQQEQDALIDYLLTFNPRRPLDEAKALSKGK